MIILGCDGGCGKRSPNERGDRIADGWVTITVQRQRDRESSGKRMILCEECLPKVDGSHLRTLLSSNGA